MHGEIDVFGHQVRQRSQFGDCDYVCSEFEIVHHVCISVRDVAASSLSADVDGRNIARAKGTLRLQLPTCSALAVSFGAAFILA